MKRFGADAKYFTFTISFINFSPRKYKIFLPAKVDGNLCADNIYSPSPKVGSQRNLARNTDSGSSLPVSATGQAGGLVATGTTVDDPGI